MAGTPFTAEDLERPSDEGRSLHDEISTFARAVMNLPTPLLSVPSKKAFTDAFKSTDGSDNRSKQLLLDLQATPAVALWPDGKIPRTPASIAWKAAADMKEKPSRKGGRKPGSKVWTKAETRMMLDIVESELPIGNDDWEAAAATFVKRGKSIGYYRDGTAMKAKFFKMAFQPKPTESAEVPAQILRSQMIKEKMSHLECIGTVLKNDETDADDDGNEDDIGDGQGDPNEKALKGTQIFKTDGIPETRQRKEAQISNSISDLGKRNMEAADKLATAVMSLAPKSGGEHTTNSTITGRLDAVERDVGKLLNQNKEMMGYLKTISDAVGNQKK